MGKKLGSTKAFVVYGNESTVTFTYSKNSLPCFLPQNSFGKIKTSKHVENIKNSHEISNLIERACRYMNVNDC